MRYRKQADSLASVKSRCKVLFDQAELREMHFKTILRHKDAELAHIAAKHEVERKRADAEAARCRTLTNQVSTFSHTEAELRSQLNIYVEKFKQVRYPSNCSLLVRHAEAESFLLTTIAGRRYAEQLQRAIFDVSKRDGGDVQEDQDAGEREQPIDTKTRRNQSEYIRDGPRARDR